MTWNFNLSEAPRGKTVITTRLVADKKSQSGKSVRDIEEFRADPLLLATKCGKVIRGYYVPSEDRWAGFANGELPLAWQLWPKHPNEASDLGLNITTKHSEIDGEAA